MIRGKAGRKGKTDVVDTLATAAVAIIDALQPSARPKSPVAAVAHASTADGISPGKEALLKKILRHTPSKRYTIDKIKSNVWYRKSYPVVDHSSQDALTIVSPTHRPTKKVKVDSSPRYADRNGSEVVSSQPVHKSDTDSDNVDSVGARGAMIVESFTQPSRFDELIIGTQIPCTPGASQMSFQRLALRMTRFYTNESSSKVWSRLQQVVKKLGYETKTSPDKMSMVVLTTDSRRQPLIFKASLYELSVTLLLVEFRRSKGDGIEFKKLFKQVKDQCMDIICKPHSIL